MFPDAGPTARALLTLEALQVRPGITAAELAERLGVTERAARRGIATLRQVGVPVESSRGPHGGYRLGRGLRLPPLVFSASEALELVMAVLDGNHQGVAVGTALRKLVSALPENVSRQAALVLEHAAATPDSRGLSPDPSTMTALVAAVAAQRSVEIQYATGQRLWRERVDPWAVVVRSGAWYLLCHSHRVDAVRSYRIDRVAEVVQTDEAFEPPAGLDPAAALAEHLSRGWAHPTRVVVDAPMEQVLPWLRASMGRLEPLGDDRCMLVGSTNNPDMYLGEYLAGLPFGLHIVAGPELRQAAVRLAERMSVAAQPMAAVTDEVDEA